MPIRWRNSLWGCASNRTGSRGPTIISSCPAGRVCRQGKVVESDPPRRLVTTFQPHSPAGELIPIAESRLTWEITEMGETCKLVLVHDRLDGSNPHAKGFGDGWNMFLSGLKGYLEKVSCGPWFVVS